MCDEITEFENQGFYEKEVTRREFNLMAGGAAIGRRMLISRIHQKALMPPF